MKTSPVRKSAWLVLLIVLALAQSACNYATQFISGISTQKSGALQPASCDNKYLPAKAGATWTFGLGNTQISESYTISHVTPTSFQEDVENTPLKYSIFWSCTSSGLVYPGTDNNNMFTDGTGVTIPASINAGDQWTQTYSSKTDTYAISYKALGEESITVPAGTFTAMKIQKISVIKGIGSQSAINEDAFEWWAAGIGTVKKSTTYKSNTNTFGLDYVLQSYHLP